MMRRTVRRRPLAPPNPADPDTPAPTPGVAGPGRVATGCADRASTAVDALRPQPVALPTGFRVALDRGARWTGDGTALIGGSPLRVLRLTPAGRDLVGRLASGEPVPPAEGAQRLARRLLDAGLAHPRPPAPAAAPDLAVVIPVHDDADGLRATLAALRRPQAAAGGSDPTGIAGRAGPTAVADDGPGVPVVVVDDASAVPVTVGAGGAGGVAVVRRARQGGPAAARNDGWRATGAELVAFVDANCEPDTGWLDTVLPHFGDPLVAAVAPRIVPAPHPAAPGWLAAYEDGGSPLDLGAGEAIVRPRSPVAYVPTAALVVRRAALEALGGFDESLTVGEDVDFVWRLAAAGWTIRYEPRATVRHPMRPTVAAWLAQRYRYGTSAAALARRHGAAVAPAVVSPRTAAAWALVAAGHPLAGASAAASSVAVLTGAVPRRRSPGPSGRGHPQAVSPPPEPAVGLPPRDAVRLAGAGLARGGLALARAVRRAWAPAAVVLAVASRRSRPALAAAVLVPSAVEWRRRRPRLDPVRFAALHLADDLAYAAGVWAGCGRERSARALWPDLGGARRDGARQTGGSRSPSSGGRA